MRPDYDGVKFYGKGDMANSIQLEKADAIIFSFDKNSEYIDINAVLELYNIQQLYNAVSASKVWTNEEFYNRKQKVNSMTSVIGKLFSKINENNWLDYVNDVASIYIRDFWVLFARFKVYERVKEESFAMYLKNQESPLRTILKQEKIVKNYDEGIAFVLRESHKTAQLLSEKYMRAESIDYYFPKSFEASEYESIFQKYIDSDNVDPNVLNLIMDAQSSDGCPISDKLRLNATRRFQRFWQENKEDVHSVGYSIVVKFVKQDEIKRCEDQGDVKLITYDVRWFEKYLDYPTILNNFIYVFEMTDWNYRSNFVSLESDTGLLEQLFSVKGKRSYTENTIFGFRSDLFALQMKFYVEFLNEHKINIEEVFRWFFEEYLIEEFSAKGFRFTPSTATTYLEKFKNLASEMEGVLKQFRMYVENDEIDRELYEMSSEHLFVENLPSFIKNKYAYSNDKSTIKTEMLLLFSDQTALSFIERTKDKYSTLYELLINEEILYSDFEDYQKGDIDWLIEQGDLGLTKDEVVYLRKPVAILKDLYDHEAVCDYKMPSYKAVLDEMVEKGKLVRSSTLFSKPEVDYLNYALNKSSFSNGLDLRNKYLHATYPMDTEVQYRDYIELLKIVVLIIIKINDEFCERDKMKTDKDTIEKE